MDGGNQMPVLREVDVTGEIIWLGCVPATGGISAQARTEIALGFGGLAGERHEGVNSPACVRVRNVYPKGTEIRNVRQVTILSEEELSLIAKDMGLPTLDPQYLGASIVIRGIADFTFVPPSSRLQGPDGVTLTVNMENRPCIFPGKEINKGHTGYGPKFKPAAKNRRGITAWVERPGMLSIGDRLRLFVPDQRAWKGEAMDGPLFQGNKLP